MDKKIQKFQKIQKSGQRVAAAPLLLSSTSPLLLLFNASGPAATMEQGRSKGRSGARVALERGAHFEGGGDGWSPATRTAGSGRHTVTGTAASGRHAVTGTRRRARGGTR